MANKITLTRNDKYVETPFTVKVTGSNLSGKILKAYYTNDITTSWKKNFNNRTINNNTTYTAQYIPSQSFIEDVYNQALSNEELKLVIEIYDPSTQKVITKYRFTSYLDIIIPEFVDTPSYEVVDNISLTLTNDSQKVISGLSSIEISNILAKPVISYKQSQPKYICLRINESEYKYSYENNYSQNKLIVSHLPIGNDLQSVVIFLEDARGYYGAEKILILYNNISAYHSPIINEFTVERDGVSSTTKLLMRGVYTEGYDINVNPLVPSYKYQELTNDGSGVITDGQTTQFTITKSPTQEWQDYLSIQNELNNHHWELSQYESEPETYYSKSVWENDGIKDLFEMAITYNNKYTQEYLEQDYNSTLQRYYCVSGGYNGYWQKFWEDTLKEIKKAIYGTYIYGGANKDYGIGGNYQFEIQSNAIKGDITSGFSLDKAFNVWGKIIDILWFEEKQSILPTAIPSIDIYKDKVALHGLFDENISDSDIQLWGNVYLNGSKINAGVLQMVQTANLDTLSTNYNYFPLFYSNSEIDVPVSTTQRLSLDHKTINYGDRTNSTVYGATIGSGVELIKVNFSVRYLNNHTANQAISTSIFVYKNNSSSVMYGCSTTAGANNRLTETGNYYLEVEEGDFVFLVGWRGVKNSDVDVIASNNATNMSIEIIN